MINYRKKRLGLFTVKTTLKGMVVLIFLFLNGSVQSQAIKQNCKAEAVQEDTANGNDQNVLLYSSAPKVIISASAIQELEPRKDQLIGARFVLSGRPSKTLNVKVEDNQLILESPVDGQLNIIDQSGGLLYQSVVKNQRNALGLETPKAAGRYLVQILGSDGNLYESVIKVD